ncbi:melanopsin-like [Actinia tenebrosa]|uniref:Melanopsin-like n=1 Tax=Actinia tenebrosa TaxID=6105 RepID=A0A6P8H9R3_ACTTE|nr:melanopsin-like [Actinia tenebrosa]
MNGTTSELKGVNYLIYAIIQSLVAVLSVVTNGLLLVVLYKNPNKSFRKPFSVLIIALVATDFLKGLLADSISAWINYQYAFGRSTWLVDDWNFYTVLDYALDNAATLLVILFAADRLVALVFSLYYRSSVTARKTSAAVAIVWVYSLAFSGVQFAGMEDTKYDLLDVFLHIVIPMITMFIIHTTMYCFLKKKRKVENAAYANSNQETPRWIQKNLTIERNFRFVAIFITLTLTISQLPYLSLVLLKWKCQECLESEWLEEYELFAEFTLCITSVINPMLYCWRVKQYRRSLKALVTCKNKGNDHDSSVLDSGPVINTINRMELVTIHHE